MSEHGGRGAEEEGDDEDEDNEGAKKNTDASPDGDAENTIEEVDSDTELDGDGPSEVTELNSLGDGLSIDVYKVQDVALLEPSNALGTKAQGLLVDGADESSLEVESGALDHVLGGSAEEGPENLGAEQREGEDPEGWGEQGDTTSDLLDSIVERLGTLGSLGTLRSTGGNDQLLDENRSEQTHEDGKEPKESRGQAIKEKRMNQVLWVKGGGDLQEFAGVVHHGTP